MCPIFGFVMATLTTAFDVAPVARVDAIIIAPPAAIDLEDAKVGGTIGVVVGRSGIVL